MEKVDALRLLGLPINADIKSSDFLPALKKAYRALAIEKHPDKDQDNPNAVKIFQEISAANELLLKLADAPEDEILISPQKDEWDQASASQLKFISKLFGQIKLDHPELLQQLEKRGCQEEAAEYQQACSPDTKQTL